MAETDEKRDIPRERQRTLRDISREALLGLGDYQSSHGFGRQPSSFTEFKQRGNDDFRGDVKSPENLRGE